MTIAIVGTGNMARGLVRRAAAAGLPLVVAGRSLEKAGALAHAAGGSARAVGLGDAAREAEVVVLAVPFASIEAALGVIGDLTGKVVVDISNPVTPDFMALTVGFTTSAAEELQKRATGARVVKAFNTVFASVFDLPEAERAKVQVFHAADDAAAGSEVAALIRALGFAPVHAGRLANARYLEPLGELNIHFGYALGWGTDTAPVWLKLAA